MFANLMTRSKFIDLILDVTNRIDHGPALHNLVGNGQLIELKSSHNEADCRRVYEQREKNHARDHGNDELLGFAIDGRVF